MNKKQFEDKYLTYKYSYDIGEPIISDDEFNAFEEMGKSLFPDSKVFDIVGEVNDDDKYKVVHKKPMMSLDKKYTIEEVLKWAKDKWLCSSLKMDGCACSLHYTNGVLEYGVTRGDGIIGQDISNSLMYVHNFPRVLTDTSITEVRGELVITQDNFNRLQDEQRDRKLRVSKTRRNCITGLVNPNRNNDFDLAQYIDFIAYDLIDDGSNERFYEEFFKFVHLQSLGFKTACITKEYNEQDIIDRIKQFKESKEKNEFPYLVDGLVFTYNDIDSQDEHTNKNPKWKIAYKLENEIISVVITDIIYEISGYGNFNFVAIFDPVIIGGVEVNKATLHNLDYMKKHKINIGAVIGVSRRGEVIPKHEVTYIENGDYILPTICPVCGGMLETNDVLLYCVNENCESKIIGRLNKWINVIQAMGVSDKTILSLYRNNLIKHPKDLYNLNIDDIQKIDRMGVKSAIKIVESIIKHSADLNHSDILYGANIEGLGSETCKTLIDYFRTIPNMIETMTVDNLISLKDIGEKTAELVLKNKENILSFYTEMKDVVTIKEAVKEEKVSDKLMGKKFCITGTLSIPREAMEKIIKDNSGTVVTGVSKSLNYLIVGTAPGNNKIEKAVQYGIKQISEQEFEDLLK